MSLPERAIALLPTHSGVRLSALPALVGIDGFVDTILHVVGQRQSAIEYTRLAGIKEFAARIAAAAGESANFEMVTRMIKLGGNGPIMANSLAQFGLPISYLGNLGDPNLHPIFEEFASRCVRVVSVAEPGLTDAIEFEDGKLMCGKHESLKEVHWENILRHVPLPELTQLFAGSALIALVNWTMMPHTTSILRAILRSVVPRLPAWENEQKRWAFFDLADPAKRTREDLADLLDVLMDFQRHFKVILGLNLPECRQIGGVLGLPDPGESHAAIAEHAARIQDKLRLETVVIHPTHFAAAADGKEAVHVQGPYTPKPLITTGAGDHFNSGFCLGRLLGGGLEESLQLGVATSGYYVRHAASPSPRDLETFLREI